MDQRKKDERTLKVIFPVKQDKHKRDTVDSYYKQTKQKSKE